MSEYWTILLTLAAAQVAIAMSPGPNTVLLLHNAATDRRLGVAVALGFWPAAFLWATAGLAGLGALFATMPWLATAMNLVCGGYLVWLGFKAFRASFRVAANAYAAPNAAPSLLQAFRAGAITNFTNPKAIPFFMSIFAATGSYGLPLRFQILAVLMMPTIAFLWNMLLVMLVSSTPVRLLLGAARHWLDRVAGGIMILFGVKLLAQR